MSAIKNILVATDFSEPSGAALAYGRDMARTHGARLHALHVLEDLAARYPTELGFPLPSVVEQRETAARRVRAHERDFIVPDALTLAAEV